jgi:hypothetical protein
MKVASTPYDLPDELVDIEPYPDIHKIVLEATRKKWGTSTAYRRGRMARSLGYTSECPYPRGSRGEAHYLEGYYFLQHT